jgi:hypothetical protein
MKIWIFVVTAMVFALAPIPCFGVPGAKGDPLCSPLRTFVASVKKDESRTLEFRTSWGTDFKDSPSSGNVFAARRCMFADYEPGRSVCDYLMEHGAIEFSENNAKNAIVCLAPAMRFPPNMTLDRIAVSFYYGTESRGSNIQITFAEDRTIGGMVLTIKADGY